MSDHAVRPDAADRGLWAALNCIIDALIVHSPDIEPMLRLRFERKRDEMLGAPMPDMAGHVLDNLLRAMDQSAQALNRKQPLGRA